MTTPHCASPEAIALGCTCQVSTHNGKGVVFIPLTCPIHSQFYKSKEE
jgi:hypothetical protein